MVYLSICIKLVSITASVCAHGKKYVWWDILLWDFADIYCLKIGSEYDQEIQQSQTADNPVAPRGFPLQII